MKWYHYVMCFFGGAFATNFVPHFVNGISGRTFPTPLNPPPAGMSSPVVNVVWALINLAVAYLLLRYGRFESGKWGAVLPAFVAAVLMAVMLANTFSAIPR